MKFLILNYLWVKHLMVPRNEPGTYLLLAITWHHSFFEKLEILVQNSPKSYHIPIKCNKMAHFLVILTKIISCNHLDVIFKAKKQEIYKKDENSPFFRSQPVFSGPARPEVQPPRPKIYFFIISHPLALQNALSGHLHNDLKGVMAILV